jgi:uncharacterized RDD family membrane protein YckC
MFAERSWQNRGRPPVYDAYPSTEGVLGRRVMAYLIDLLFIALFGGILTFLFTVLTILSFGLLAHLFVLLPLTGIAYATLQIGGAHSATWGMRVMSLAYRRADGGRPDLLHALAVTLLFYVSIALTSWLILLLALFTERHRTLHDLLSGLVMVRTDGDTWHA